MRKAGLKKQSGFTIVELSITLVIVVLAGAGLLYKGRDIYEWFKVYQVTDQVTDVQKAANSWGSNSGIYTTISKTVLASYVPKSHTWVNTYGGAVDVKPGTQNYEYIVTSANIPDTTGKKIADKFPSNAVYDTGTKIVTFTFGT